MLSLLVALPEEGSSPHNADHSRASYHIVASVYLWNIDWETATHTHASFLDNANWCLRHRKLVVSYLLLTFTLNNHAFINSKVIDYPVMRQAFEVILRTAWQHDEQRPEVPGFKRAMVLYINQMWEGSPPILRSMLSTTSTHGSNQQVGKTNA